MNCNDSTRMHAWEVIFLPALVLSFYFHLRSRSPRFAATPNKETCSRMTRQSHLQRYDLYIHTDAHFGLW